MLVDAVYLSQYYRAEHLSSALCRGTLPYMAPELVSDPERVSEKADVWSLGMVLWELLTLEVPFTQLSPQQIIHGLMIGNLQPPVRPPLSQHTRETNIWKHTYLDVSYVLHDVT